MTPLYRVQGADGRGPWRPGFSHRWIEADACAGRLVESVRDLMPLAELALLPRDRHYGCACRTIPALMAWFTPAERAALARFGFYPVGLWVDEVLRESASQVIFARRRPLAEGATRLRWR